MAGAVRPVSLLSETGVRVQPEAFLEALAPAYARWEAVFVTQGFGPLRAEWLAHAARLAQDAAITDARSSGCRAFTQLPFRTSDSGCPVSAVQP